MTRRTKQRSMLTIRDVVSQAGTDCAWQNGDKINVGGVVGGDVAGVPLLLQGHEGPLGGSVWQVARCSNL